jgi:hypothetical protein
MFVTILIFSAKVFVYFRCHSIKSIFIFLVATFLSLKRYENGKIGQKKKMALGYWSDAIDQGFVPCITLKSLTL